MQPQTFKPIFGEHPHGGTKAVVYFQDRYLRPCTEDLSTRAVYVEYDNHGRGCSPWFFSADGQDPAR